MTGNKLLRKKVFPHIDGCRRSFCFAVLTVILSSGLYITAFPPFNIAENSYIFLLPWLFWLAYSPSWKSVCVSALASGFISWVALIFWLRHVTWAGMLFLSFILALFLLLWLLAARWVWPKFFNYRFWQRLLVMVGLAGLWTLLEYVRAHIFTGFPWLPLAAAQWNRPAMLQILAYTGCYGLSFVLVFFNIGLTVYLHKLIRPQISGQSQQRLRVEFYIVLSLLFFVFGLSFKSGFFQREYDRSIKVGWVQPYIPYDEKWDKAAVEKIREILTKRTLRAKEKGAEIILWPEAVTPYPAFSQDFTLLEWVQSLSNEIGVPILMGSLAVKDDQWRNIICICGPESGLAQPYYSKRRLVPFGEYIPLSWFLPFLEKVIPIENLFPGKEAILIPAAIGEEAYQFGPLVCYEDVFPHLARVYGRQPVDFIFVATNNAWYGEEAGAHQHAIHSVLRAVETRRPILRSGNGGWSGWIDAYGRVRYEMTDPEEAANGIYFRGEAVRDVHFNSENKTKRSFYSQNGDWFILLCGVSILGAFFIVRSNN